MRHARLAALAFLSACLVGQANTGPVPELPSGTVWQRGTDAQAQRLGNADEAEIVANVVRGFFRPIRGQVRIIHDRPLSNFQDVVADSAMPADRDRADALVRAIGLERVCTQAANTACSGLPGGTLRFSPAYGVARDTALIYAQYGPTTGTVAGLEFRMARRSDGWHMVSRRSVSALTPENAPARRAANQLLETDRAYGVAARGTDLVTALGAMFDDSVVMQVPGGFADGKAAAVTSLRANADNERSHATWAPIRVGVSADGRHGFSYGYMTLTRPDGVRVPIKYLAYWVRRGDEWKVLAYKRRPRPAGEVSLEVLPPALPRSQSQSQSQSSLAAAEKEFSDTSQAIGIGAAFERYGRMDAMNMGGPTDTAFVIGNKAVGRSVGAGYPATGSPVHWASDYKTIVASSGDLGVTFGYIRPHTPPPAGQPQFFPFFTIWKRDPGGPWRYIAE